MERENCRVAAHLAMKVELDSRLRGNDKWVRLPRTLRALAMTALNVRAQFPPFVKGDTRGFWMMEQIPPTPFYKGGEREWR